MKIFQKQNNIKILLFFCIAFVAIWQSSADNKELYKELCRYQIPSLKVQYTENCAQFVVCYGIYYLMTCPDGLYFDNKLQRCNWEQEVKCPDVLESHDQSNY